MIKQSLASTGKLSHILHLLAVDLYAQDRCHYDAQGE